MRRFYLDITADIGDIVNIPQTTAHHIFDVLRLKVGTQVVFFDGSKKCYLAELLLREKNNPQAKIVDTYKAEDEIPVQIILGQALVASNKFESVLQKCAELGVTTIMPFTCERSVHLSTEKINKKKVRWQKIVAEASRQGERVTLPKVETLQKWPEIINYKTNQILKLIAWAREPSKHLKNALQSAAGYDKIITLVGPEGGFSEREIAEATAKGFIPINLGKLVLRTETAGPAALAMLSYHFNGDKNG